MMITKYSVVLSTFLIGVTSGVAIYLLWRRKRRHGFVHHNIDPKEVYVVSNSEQWEQSYEALKTDLQIIKVLGFDCEWANVNRHARPVSLLQFASVSGTCILVRLSAFAPCSIPETLKKLLNDRSVLKVGVASLEDGKRLERDHGLFCQGCVDLRNVALRTRITLRSNGLKAMAKEIIGVDMDKNTAVRISNWEAELLTPEQIRYAALDAIYAVCIFMALVNLKNPKTDDSLAPDVQIGKRVASFCQGLVDLKYSLKSNSKKENCVSTNVVSQVDSGRSNTRAYVTRKKPLYHNCQLVSPDGQLLCTCDLKKAQWYLDKDLGVKICDEPLKIQLKFEPAGRPLDENNYYLQEKNNVCVVCGKSESYIRKNVIPHEYRKHFPSIMKEHKSHDVVLLCTSCHLTSNLCDGKLKQKLARIYSAEQTSGKNLHSSELLKVKSAAKALISNSSHIPEQRLKELEQVIRDYYGVVDVDTDLLSHTLNLETRLKNQDFCEHGLKVVQCVMEQEGLLAFERMWRQHFLDTMQPAFLPDLWSVDHSHDELISMGLQMKGAIRTNNLPANSQKL